MTTPQEHPELKPIGWKSTVVAPQDAARPKCKVILSTNGTSGRLVENDTDEQDWLVAIAYQPKEPT